MVGHLVNTLVFVLSGIIIVTSIDWRSTTLGADIGFGILSYFLMTIYRAIVMFGVIPIFRRGHYSYTWREALVITWGGLRGAVGLALAISVFLDDSLPDYAIGTGTAAHYRQIVLIHTSLTVTLTLLINAPSSAPILRVIGLTKLSNTRVSMLQMSQQLLRQRMRSTLSGMCSHPVHSDVNWERCQELANFEEMSANILGQKYIFNAVDAWAPPKQEDAEGKSKGRRHRRGSAHGGVFEAVGCRRRRVDSKEEMGASDSRKHADNTELTPERAAAAEDRWRKLQTKLVATVAMAGSDFVVDFKARLHEKRMHEAKYRLLEQLKASFWSMYESGQIRPYTAQRLKQMVMDQIDALEVNKEVDLNPLPFAPLRNLLHRRASVLQCSNLLGRFGFAHGNTLLFREFERGYDATVGYLLAHEEVLASHDHGHTFSLDRSLDLQFKKAVKVNINDAIKNLALLRLDWPKLCTALNTFKAARLVLNGGQSLVSELGHHGVLHETETERLLDAIAEAKSKLNLLSPLQALPPEERANFFPSSTAKVHTEAEMAAMQKQLGRIEATTSMKTIAKIGSFGSSLGKKGSFKVVAKTADGGLTEGTPAATQPKIGLGMLAKVGSMKKIGSRSRMAADSTDNDVENGIPSCVAPTPPQEAAGL